ncbi:MAG: hypothetical protein SNJ57_05375 [Cyanobacteriota bacterium]
MLEFAQELDYSQLAADLRSQSAILHQIGVMGEATKRLSRDPQSSRNLQGLPPRILMILIAHC